jgi:hypothetical protein
MPDTSRDDEALAEQPDLAAGTVPETLGQRLTATIQLHPGTLLPAGTVEPGTIRIVDNVGDWDELRFGQASKAFSGLGTYDPRVRMLLIGARPEPFECRWVRVIPGDETYRVQLSGPAADGLAAVHGCAIALPRDGRRIVMDYSQGFE